MLSDGKVLTVESCSIFSQIFPANRDRNSIVYHTLRSPLVTRYVRFQPGSWYGHVSMRVELYGQRKGKVFVGFFMNLKKQEKHVEQEIRVSKWCFEPTHIM